MLRKIIIAAAAATLLAGSASVAAARSHHSGLGYGSSYGYSAGDRGDATNTNGF